VNGDFEVAATRDRRCADRRADGVIRVAH
jgi:hypothetical protein